MPQKKHKVSKKLLFNSCLAMAGTSIFLIFVFYWLYAASKENILAKWKNETIRAAQQVNYYLKMPMDAVAFSAVKLNDMMERKVPVREAAEYLINETAIYSSIINENNTGVYSYYQGEYLDGSGWIPPEDYQPKMRPWYTEAVKGQGETVLVQPFLNLQTNTMMMSVSQLLEDSESVVSMDIFLDSVQTMMEKVAQDKTIRVAMVMDSNAFVLAHSDREIVGVMFEELTPVQKILQKKIFQENQRQFLIRDDNKNFTVFAESVNSDWHAIFILDNSRLYHSLLTIYIFSGLVILSIMTVILILFIRISRKYEEAEALTREVQAVADIYTSVIMINLKKDTFTYIRGNPEKDRILDGDFSNFHSRSVQIGDKISAEQSKDLMKNFMNPETLEERFKGVNSLSQEFMAKNEQWMRIRFIVIDRDDDGYLHHIMMAFESIDEDRKRQEKLRRLSETDMMTGIRNRGSGEYYVRKAMAEGRTGMFCLMDADKFKSINDTFGHSVGDKVIIAIADCLKKTFRESDIIFRLGGDEFAVFSEGVTSEEIGNSIFNRLFKHIDKVEIPELDGRKIEVSVGAVFYPATKEDSFEAMYQRADRGTYKSKEFSGNKVTFEV